MNKPNKTRAIAIVILCTLVTAIAQIMWKTGANSLPTITWQLITGFALYAIGAALLIYALTGATLTLLYPMIATSYIWVNILAWIIFNEPLTLSKWIGIVSIIAGLVFVGIGGRHE